MELCWNYSRFSSSWNRIIRKKGVKYDGVYRNVELETPGEELFDKNGKRLDGHIRKLFWKASY